MKGKIDAYDQQSVRGWAWNPDSPDLPVVLQIKTSDGRSKVFSADGFREDLAQAGIGDGRHGFVVSIEDWELHDGTIIIQSVGGTPVMIGTPMQLSPTSIFSQKAWAGKFRVILSNEIVSVHEAIEAQKQALMATDGAYGQ